MKSLQTSNPQRIQLVSSRLVREPNRVESKLHAFLDAKRTDGGREWFELADAQVIEIVTMLASEDEVQLLGRDFRTQVFLSEMQHERHQILARLVHIEAKLGTKLIQVRTSKSAGGAPKLDDHELEERALAYFHESGHVSSSSLQRKFSIGYSKAARIVDSLEEQGYISAWNGNPKNGRELIIDARVA